MTLPKGRADDVALDATLNRLRNRTDLSVNRLYLTAGDFIRWDNATTADLSNKAGGVSFPTGVDSFAGTSFRVNPAWAGGGELVVTIYFSASSSTNDIDIHIIGYSVKDGDGFAALSADVSAEETIAVTALDFDKHQFAAQWLIDGGHDICTLQFRRDGGDTNAGNFILIGALVEFYPDH